MTRLVRRCAVPGCDARLQPDYASYAHGVCKQHRHAEGLCQCPTCAGPRDTARSVGRDDLRVVEVPYATGNSGIGGSVRVSQPIEPWLRKRA